jgi:hypothetical protein
LQVLLGPLGEPLKIRLRARHHQNVFHVRPSFSIVVAVWGAFIL